jgi:glutamate racemase
VLGCSHYPYLIPSLKEILPPHVQIIDSGMAVAKQTKVVLQSLDLLSEQQQHIPEFFTNGDPEVLQNIIPSPAGPFVVKRMTF